MKKTLTGILGGLVLLMISYLSVSHKAYAATDSVTPWVNDSVNGSGFYLDPLSCQVWTPDLGWHYRPPAGQPFWVNYPYGPAATGGGFYWDSVSCQVWTADANWHVFNPIGIWPAQVGPICPEIKRDTNVLIPTGCSVVGDVFTSPDGVKGNFVFQGKGVEGVGTLVIVKNAPVWILAPYGARSTADDPQVVETGLRAPGGCGRPAGCTDVTIVTK